MNTRQIEIINTVYQELKDRKIHPSGKWDNGGRFYAKHGDLISVRSPSRAYPLSEMSACRTKKYVAKVAGKFGCDTIETLLANV
tara:strand:+ start:419 stop:670 length:252 start_codon:yes stop_codon:yes gene_type:complete